ATPMTFMGSKTGKQFVVIAAGGGGRYNKTHDDAVVAFALFAEGQERPTKVLSSNEKRIILTGPGHEPNDLTASTKAEAQPIPFSHRQHSQLGIECSSCHPTALTGDLAQIPVSADCMSCHQAIKSQSTSIQKLAHFEKQGKSIPWIRVYQLPDFVFFSHRKHTNAGTECQSCHGPVQSRDVLWQEKDLSMDSCVACHKLRKASVDCNICHEMTH